MARLGPTLEHLSAQRLSRPWEVVVVDNASDHDPSDAARAMWKQCGYSAPFRVVAEPRLGLAHARDTGVQAAGHECVIFCDDDNWLAPDYAARVCDLFDTDPAVGVVGGRSEPQVDVALPAWFWTYAADFAVGVQGTASGDLTERGYLWGAGMGVRRSVYSRLKALGARNFLADRQGNLRNSGGDAEICMWHLLAGYRLWYEENLFFRHYIPAERLTVSYLRSLHAGFRETERVISRYRLARAVVSEASPLTRLRNAAMAAGKLALGRVDAGPALQAFLPLPGITFDVVTRDIVEAARRIRKGFAEEGD